MYFMLYVDRTNISTAAPLIKADLNLSNTQLGFAFSAFAVPYALFQLFGGWIGDRFGPRRTLSACCAIVAVSTALSGAAGGLWSFGYLIDRTGNWVVPFGASIVLLLLGAVLALRSRPDQPFTDSDVQGNKVLISSLGQS
jgi:MFS family permease